MLKSSSRVLFLTSMCLTGTLTRTLTPSHIYKPSYKGTLKICAFSLNHLNPPQGNSDDLLRNHPAPSAAPFSASLQQLQLCRCVLCVLVGGSPWRRRLWCVFGRFLFTFHSRNPLNHLQPLSCSFQHSPCYSLLPCYTFFDSRFHLWSENRCSLPRVHLLIRSTTDSHVNFLDPTLYYAAHAPPKETLWIQWRHFVRSAGAIPKLNRCLKRKVWSRALYILYTAHLSEVPQNPAIDNDICNNF